MTDNDYVDVDALGGTSAELREAVKMYQAASKEEKRATKAKKEAQLIMLVAIAEARVQKPNAKGLRDLELMKQMTEVSGTSSSIKKEKLLERGVAVAVIEYATVVTQRAPYVKVTDMEED